jgi:hypothetical protein
MFPFGDIAHFTTRFAIIYLRFIGSVKWSIFDLSGFIPMEGYITEGMNLFPVRI